MPDDQDPASSPPPPRPSSSDSRRVVPKWLGKKIGRFRLQGLLGQGASGRVFRAEDAILHRRVALKVIVVHSDQGQVNRAADQFLTEARAAAALEHPNVVQIYEAGESGNLCYIAMELLEGGSLRDLVQAAGPMDPGRACLLIADAADALAAGHEAGIIHRDVKPANLMLSRQGRCKVTDFGLATFGAADSVSTERAAGTPLFAAPEVIRGTSADERSDIYSLGATLFYLLAGRPPYTAQTRAEVLQKHLTEPIPDLRAVRPGLPEPLVAAVEKALDKDPGQRFGSATQFARLLRVQTIPAAPLPTLPPPQSGETIGGASLADLPAASGRLDASGPMGGSSKLSAGDLLGGRPRRGAAEEPATPTPTVDYFTPPPAPRPWYRSSTRLAAAIVVAVVGLTLIAFPLLFHTRHAAWVVPPTPVPATPMPLTAVPTPPALVPPPALPADASPPPATPTPVAVAATAPHTFIYAPPPGVAVRSVAMVGDFNDWSLTATPMARGLDGVFSVTVDLPVGRHQYKFVADGTWLNDPTANPALSVNDGHNGRNSGVDVRPPAAPTGPLTPCAFRYVPPPGAAVTAVAVTGDFNGWSRTANPLDRQPDGTFAATVPLPDGLYHYKLLIDGKWTTDPAADKALESSDGFGTKNSGLRVGPAHPQ